MDSESSTELVGHAGFRSWWRRWRGSDQGLENNNLMRIAGRFARRVKGWAQSNGVPIVYSKAGERTEDLGELSPQESKFRGRLPDRSRAGAR